MRRLNLFGQGCSTCDVKVRTVPGRAAKWKGLIFGVFHFAHQQWAHNAGHARKLMMCLHMFRT